MRDTKNVNIERARARLLKLMSVLKRDLFKILPPSALFPTDLAIWNIMNHVDDLLEEFPDATFEHPPHTACAGCGQEHAVLCNNCAEKKPNRPLETKVPEGPYSTCGYAIKDVSGNTFAIVLNESYSSVRLLEHDPLTTAQLLARSWELDNQSKVV